MNFFDARRIVVQLINDRRNNPGGTLKLISQDKEIRLVQKIPQMKETNFIANITDYDRMEGLTSASWDHIFSKISTLCERGLL